MTRVAITGAAGRMGRTLVETVHRTDGLELGAAFERSDSTCLGADAGEIAAVGKLGIPITTLADSAHNYDVLIDFSVPDATLAMLPGAVAHNTRLVIGTTGIEEAGLAAIREASTSIPIMHAPNMSVGVNLAFKLIELAAQVFGDDVDIEIIEAHHRDKVDAPSGTALRMGEIVAGALGRNLDDVAVYGRQGITGARDRNTIGFETIRAGDLVGEHTVMYVGVGERIEITHRASSRLNFAQGAMRAVKFLENRENGLFDMQDVLGLAG